VRKRIRRPSPALAISLIALFVALGGTGYAAITINGKNIKNNSIPGKKLKNKAVTGKKVKSNTLTGTQINESTLGKVPSATAADTAGSAGTANTANSANTLAGQGPGAFAEKRAGLTTMFLFDDGDLENQFGPQPTVIDGTGVDTYTFPYAVNDGSHNIVVSGGGAAQTGGFTPACYHVVDPNAGNEVDVFSFEADGTTTCDEEYTLLVF
jgi:hypothetical protein